MFRIVELVIEKDLDGIDAVSLVDSPAIEENFIALNKEYKIEFAEVDSDKRILMGAALIPNKQIYRKNGKDEFYVFFSEATVKQASELFLKNGNQSNATLEHKAKFDGATVVESWIIDNPEMDKSKQYGFSLPKGTWMISMKIEDENVWKQVKEGKYKGFSIEGYFADKLEMSGEINLESYSDYGDDVKSNAQKGIELNEKNGNKCATQTGKVRAQQLANGEPISVETIKRMYSYLSRAETFYDNAESQDDCGNISYLLWGGKSALSWSRNKLKELDLLELQEEELINQIINILKDGE
jgi:Putative phage serine protease XkdF